MDMSQSRRSVFDSAPLYSYMLIKRHALPMCEGAALHLRSRSVNIRRRRTFGKKQLEKGGFVSKTQKLWY